MKLGEPSGENWENPNGPDAVQRFETLYKNPLEVPKGIPSQGHAGIIACKGKDINSGKAERLTL